MQDVIRRELRDELNERAAVIRVEADRHERTLKRIESKQEKLIQLYYKDLVSEDVLEREQEKLKGPSGAQSSACEPPRTSKLKTSSKILSKRCEGFATRTASIWTPRP